MSALSGLLGGTAIAILEVVAKHLRVGVGSYTVSGSAAAVPFVLVPLALFWGWTWASERWAGRARLRLILYTLGLYVGLALVGPLDALVFAPELEWSAFVAATSEVGTRTLLFAMPAAIAAIFYWAFRSKRLPTNRVTLALGYLIGPSLALLMPIVAVGTVAGTATGHAWQSPSARTPIAMLVVLLMLGVAFGAPYLLAAAGVVPTPAHPLLP